MSSTLTLPATAWRAPALGCPALAAADALLLPAATAAPDALVIAVEAPASQETSALVQGSAAGRSSDIGAVDGIAGSDVVVGGMSDEAVLRASAAVAAYAAPAAAVVRTRTHVQGPPSRGTPV